MTIKQDNDTVGSYFFHKKTNIHFERVQVNESPETWTHVGGLNQTMENVTSPLSGRKKRRREMWNANTELVFRLFPFSSVLQTQTQLFI